MEMANPNALPPREHLFLPGLETFRLSPQNARSEASSSPCSIIDTNNFYVDISNVDVSVNFQSDLTRPDMVSALDWLENLDSEQIPGAYSKQHQQYNIAAYKDTRPNFDVTAAVSFPGPPGMTTEQRYHKPEAEINFTDGGHFRQKEPSRREQNVLHYGSQFQHKEKLNDFPTGRHFWQTEQPYIEKGVVPTGNQYRTLEHVRPEVAISQCRNEFLTVPKQKSPHELEVFPTGTNFTHKGKQGDPTGKQRPYYLQETNKEKKRGRNAVPDECKDARYWSKRSRNNLSAKKSRAAKRVKDIYITNKIEQLERENCVLKAMLANVMTQLQQQQQQQQHQQQPLAFQW